jgi:hypothetical protein
MSIDLSERAYAMDTADKLLVRYLCSTCGNIADGRLSEQRIGRFTLSTSIHPARYTE